MNMVRPKYRGIVWRVNNDETDIIPFFTCETSTVAQCHSQFYRVDCISYVETIVRISDNTIISVSSKGEGWRFTERVKLKLCGINTCVFDQPTNITIIRTDSHETLCLHSPQALTRDEWNNLDDEIYLRFTRIKDMSKLEKSDLNVDERMAWSMGWAMFALWHFKQRGFEINQIYPR